MKKWIGWIVFIFGVLMAIYPIGWALQVLGTTMQGESPSPFDLGATLLSVILGGACIFWGWKLTHAAGPSDIPPPPPPAP